MNGDDVCLDTLPSSYRLVERDKKQYTFKIAVNKFQRQWTSKNRDFITEFEEIKDIWLKSYEDLGSEEEIRNLNYSEQRLSMDVEVLSIGNYYDSPDSLVLSFEDKLVYMTNYLLATNIYMNRSILEMIKKYEKLLDDELKSLSETVAPIFDTMREIANTYSQVINEIIKFDVDNPHKAIRKMYIDRFENRLITLTQ